MPVLTDEGAGPDLTRRALVGGVFAGTAQMSRLAIQIATTAILARLLSPAEFGVVAMVLPFVALIQLFQDAGLGNVTLHRPDLTNEQVGGLFWVNVGIGIAASAVLAGLSPLVAAFYGRPELVAPTIAYAAILIPATAAVQHRALMQRGFRFRALAGIDISIQLLAAAVAVAMAWGGAGYWSLIGQAATLALAQHPPLWAILRWHPGRPRGLASIRHLIRAGGEITGFNLMNFFARNIDNVAIGRVWGEAPLGLYSRAYNLMLAPIAQINGPVGTVAIPLLSRLAADPARYRATFRRILEHVLLATQPGVVVLIVEAEAVVRLLLGADWLAAVPILQALAFAALTQPINNTTGWLFISQGRSADLLRWGFRGAPLHVAAIAAGLPWGAHGVAIAYAAVDVLVVTPLLWRHAGSAHFQTSDALVAALPFAACSAVSGSLLHLAEAWTAGLPPPLALILGLAWTYSLQLAVLAFLPSRRPIVARLAGVGRDVAVRLHSGVFG